MSVMHFDLIQNKFNWAFSTDDYESIILKSGQMSTSVAVAHLITERGRVTLRFDRVPVRY